MTKSSTSDPYKRGPLETRPRVIHFQLSKSGELCRAIAFDEMLHVGPRLEEFFVAWDRNEYLVVIVV